MGIKIDIARGVAALVLGLTMAGGSVAFAQGAVNAGHRAEQRVTASVPRILADADRACRKPGPRGENLAKRVKDHYRLCVSLYTRPSFTTGDNRERRAAGPKLVAECRSYLNSRASYRFDEYGDCLTQSYPGQ